MAIESFFPRGATLAIVGASARAAAFSALRAGCDVVTADLFADVDLARVGRASRVSPYPDGFESWLRATPCDGWLYTGALENNPELVDRLATIRPLLGNPGDVLRPVRDPLVLQAVLRDADLRFPETTISPVPHDGRWLAKTYRGSSGSGVAAVNAAAPDAKLYYQRRVDGTPASAVYVDGNLIGVTRQLVGEPWTGAAEFKYCGTIAPWPTPPTVSHELERLGDLLAVEFQLTGLFGVDLIFAGNQVWTIEVNPRYTAATEIVERALADEGPNYHGKAILFAKAPLTVTAQASDWLSRQAGAIAWPQLADIPAAGTDIARGQPILTAFAEGATRDEVVVELQRRVSELEAILTPRGDRSD